MIITLTPEIESDLNELAEKQGTTIELLQSEHFGNGYQF
jgi:hypothetical protein